MSVSLLPSELPDSVTQLTSIVAMVEIVGRFLTHEPREECPYRRIRKCIAAVLVLAHDQPMNDPHDQCERVNVGTRVLFAENRKQNGSDENGDLVAEDEFDGVGVLRVDGDRLVPFCGPEAVVSLSRESRKKKPQK